MEMESENLEKEGNKTLEEGAEEQTQSNDQDHAGTEPGSGDVQPKVAPDNQDGEDGATEAGPDGDPDGETLGVGGPDGGTLDAGVSDADGDDDSQDGLEALKKDSIFKKMKLAYAATVVPKKKPHRIMVSKGSASPESGDTSNKITPIPKITKSYVDEIELSPIEEPYSYVRILYDNRMHEYIYETIEPPMTEDEMNVLKLLKGSMVADVDTIQKGEKEKEKYIRDMADGLLKSMDINLNPINYERIVYYLRRDLMGYGLIQCFMIEYNVEDISCDGVGIPIFIYHRKYDSIRSNIMFHSHHEVDSFVVWLAQKSGKHISVAAPVLDATIPDGSRLQATLGTHVTKKGSSFTIRRFREDPFTFMDLVRFKTLSPEMVTYLWIAIEHGQSMLICGGTASGKTTTLNALLLFIPPQMKIVTIEDTRELNLPHENWVPTLTRSGFGAKNPVTGKAAGEVDMFDLLTSALRQRPQYMMVGEIRGAEAYTVFQAMATGKASYTTFHAESTQAMVHRMENPPINLPRALLTSLDLVLLQAQVKVGTKMTRRIKGLTEIVGLDPESNEIITNTAYLWNPADDQFNYSGHSYIYEKVRAQKNWTAREMEREVKTRVDIIKYMRAMKVDNYLWLAKIISGYYNSPDKILEDMKLVLVEGKESQVFQKELAELAEKEEE